MDETKPPDPTIPPTSAASESATPKTTAPPNPTASPNPTPQPKTPTVSYKALVVIPCLNERQSLEDIVNNLVKQSTTVPMLIVIVDGGSVDQSQRIAGKLVEKFPNVRLLNNPKRVQSAALNLAVETYGNKAEYLIRIDAHAGYPQNYCETLIAEAERTKAASVVVGMKTVGKAGFQKAVAAAQNSILGNGGSEHRINNKQGLWVKHGHHALIRMNAFDSVGGYDESFSHNEDAELDVRLILSGYKIWLTQKTTLTYYPRSSALSLYQQYVSYGYGRARTLVKHHLQPEARQIMPALVAPALMLICFAPITRIMAYPSIVWILVCLGYGCAISFEKKDPALAVSGPAAMIMHFGWSLGFWHAMLDRLAGRI